MLGDRMVTDGQFSGDLTVRQPRRYETDNGHLTVAESGTRAEDRAHIHPS
jgi:hypothetical protein